jgi:pyrophosphatase PpaX
MKSLVLFDWDGTLWDALDFIVETYSEVFAMLGKTPWKKHRYRRQFTHNWRNCLKKMGLEEHENLLAAHWDRKISEKHPKAYPWVQGMLEDICLKHKVGIVSSAPKKPLIRELKKNKIFEFMEVIVSEEDVLEIKPSPEPILLACKKTGIKPDKTIYVGDMMEDIVAAKNAGTRAVAVSWGIHSKSRLLAETPDFLAETPNELSDFIKETL